MNWPSLAPYLRSVLRIVAAFLFIQFGTAKNFRVFLGLFTRPVAFLLSGEMAVAYFKGHAVRSGGRGASTPSDNGTTHNLLPYTAGREIRRYTCFQPGARAAARCTASTRLASRAAPVPAMSNAVP